MTLRQDPESSIRPTLSICCIARDAETTLARALDSASWADEVLVLVDDKSADTTEAIARERASRVEVLSYRGDIATTSECISWATSDWVMILDSDEVIPPALRQELEAALAGASEQVGGYEVNRLTHHLGRWIRHGDFFPDWVLRVVRREQLRYVGADPHGRITVRGATLRLETPLEHYSYRDLADQVARIQFFSDESSHVLTESGQRPSLSNMLLRPPARFLRAYVLKRGFLDGVPGFIIAAATAFHVFLKYAKHWEQSREPSPAPQGSARARRSSK
jgi:glycosyltransferase involved in cell wall biosynthesis